MAESVRRLADGERPRLRDIMLTPGNIATVVERLSHLRGAAMKLGQMISLDAGDLLPAELTELMARLREHAHHMPPAQLERVLAAEWGAAWRNRFRSFDMQPTAAASIGQVHEAVTLDGRRLAIKVQYPGVAESIDADVDNVATLLRVSNLLPKDLDIGVLLAEAKRQLAEETDYVREAGHLALFGRLLAADAAIVVPQLVPELSTGRVLAMTYVEGDPVETLADAPQARRDTAMARLISLVLREMFDFGIMQTDPNFANYRYQRDSGRLVLLDFGAVRKVAPTTAEAYRAVIRAGLSGDRDGVRDASLAAGFIGPAVVARHRKRVDGMIDVITGEFVRPGPFDFGDRRFVASLRDQGLELAADRANWHIPPADILFVQRKISGTALLAARLRARVDMRELVAPYLRDVGSDEKAVTRS